MYAISVDCLAMNPVQIGKCNALLMMPRLDTLFIIQ